MKNKHRKKKQLSSWIPPFCQLLLNVAAALHFEKAVTQHTELLPPCPAITVPETWHTKVTSRIVTLWFCFWQLKCQRWGCCWSCECPFTEVRMVSTAIFGHRLVHFPLAPRTDFNLGTSRQEAPSNLSDFLSSLSSELQHEGFLLLESFLIRTFLKLLVSDAWSSQYKHHQEIY